MRLKPLQSLLVAVVSFGGVVFASAADDCPPCFNCLLPAFECKQFGSCNEYSGKCNCPPGFGGDDCIAPVCGSLAEGPNRFPRSGDTCKCADGWSGINCNVCQSNSACNPLMPEGINGTCYKGGLTVNENFQMCDVTNRKIIDQLKERVPRVTFSCNREEETCKFQFWSGVEESFYCGLEACSFEQEQNHDQNITRYACDTIACRCIPDRYLCGEAGAVDITDFLTEEIRGPASFECSGPNCDFSEPEMNNLIKSVFGDESISLACDSGECLYYQDVPGYHRPEKKVDQKLVVGAVVGVSVLLLVVALAAWYCTTSTRREGAIRLPETDENGKLMIDHQPATLSFRDISYRLNEKDILQGIHGAVQSGQVMAIMGASGAGKSTLLDILAKKNKRGETSGSIYVNGQIYEEEEYHRIIGFVDQEDALMPTLTVYETILNSALLRLPKSMSNIAKQLRVLETMQELGIFGIKDQMIGSEGSRSISGGEKRRVAIACELVTSPSILFIDEPTSGLDSFNAYNVVESLVTLAQTYNRTVVFSIHQPQSNIVALFDQLILLAQGCMVYSGEFQKCQQYFSAVGYSCPSGFNIAEYLVGLMVHASRANSKTRTGKIAAEEESENAMASLARLTKGKRRDSVRAIQERQLFTRKPSGMLANVEESNASTQRRSAMVQNGETSTMKSTDLDGLVEDYRKSDLADAVKTSIEQSVSRERENQRTASPKTNNRAGLWTQFMIISKRTWKNLYRNPMLMLTHYAIAVLLALLSGFLFYNVTNDISGFQNRLGVFFFMLSLFGFSTLTTLNVFASERLIFKRERANRYYAPITYFLSKVIFDIVPLRVFPPIIMGVIVYPMVGLVNQWPEFFRFILVLVLFNLTAAAICLFVGIVFEDLSVASLVGSLVMLFSLLFAGLLLNHDSIPSEALWLQKLSIFHYAFEALATNEVRYLTLIEQKFGLSIDVPGATILSTFGFDATAYWGDIIGLVIFFGMTNLKFRFLTKRLFYRIGVRGDACIIGGAEVDSDEQRN